MCEEEFLVWCVRKSSWSGVGEKVLGLVWEKEFLVWYERKSSWFGVGERVLGLI